MIAVTLDFDDLDLRQLARAISPARLRAAIGRAVRKTALWVRTHLLRALKDHGIKRKLVVHRVRLYNKNWRDFEHQAQGNIGKAVKVWFGTDTVLADQVGRLRREYKGYSVNDYYFPTAFSPASRPGKLYQRTTSKRLPIMRSKITISHQAEVALQQLEDQVPGKLRAFVLHEMQYALHGGDHAN